MSESETQSQPNTKSSILDTIMGSQTQSNLVNFEPSTMVAQLLNLLKDRDREILTKRFGLDGLEVETLETIGQRYKLTRERVRQIEKDSVDTLKKSHTKQLTEALRIIFDTIIEHGNVMSEDFLIGTMLAGRDEPRSRASLKFLLNLSDQFKYLKETPEYYPAWSVVGFNIERLSSIVSEMVKILNEAGKVISSEELFETFRQSDYFKQHEFELNESIIASYQNVSKQIQTSAFGELGLRDWTDIKPRDVGDKAYLVLKHHGKPEHYSQITKMINEHKFDARQAYQETVHNELIKDPRFVLIGRGIYALSEWGYTKGVVADVIKEILSGAEKPLTREEIVMEVMKRRQVKRNTILVGLSNKKHFAKVGKDRYVLAQQNG